MLFPSPEFLFLFLPALSVLYYLTPVRWKNGLLLLASLLFYAWGEALYVLLMLGSVFANYLFGLGIAYARDRGHGDKLWLIAGICFNLLLLVVFKYANFLVDNVNVLLAVLQLPEIALAPVHLPLGISFFTFQAMSYIIDVYRQEAPVQRRFSNVALYIALFPQLIAGPIVRYHDIARQIVSRDADPTLVVSGIRRFLFGLAKKMLIANPMGQAADAVFALPDNEVGLALAWFGILCYALQIYFDFSGYSDMAIGLGRMFGFRFLENFNYPYSARSLQDFWRRWHISLSSWFRDYLYIPLGGNRVGPLRTYVNLFTVFFLCGLWHGASWNFVIWGMIHGCFLVLERAGLSRFLVRLWWPLQHAYTLVVVCVAWVFFRAEGLPQALSYLGVMFGLGDAPPVPGGLQMLALAPDTLLAVLVGILLSTPVYVLFSRRFAFSLQAATPAMYVTTQTVLIVFLFFVSVLAVVSTTYNPFIYFRF